MDSLARLLGSSTRANLVRALAISSSPLTSYRVARLYNMNVPKVYGEMRNLAALGVVEPTSQGRGVKYRLADDDLERLVLRLSSGVVSLSRHGGVRKLRGSGSGLGLELDRMFRRGLPRKELSRRPRGFRASS